MGQPILEYSQAVELKAKEIMISKAKDQCRELLAGKLEFIGEKGVFKCSEGFAACMKIEGYLGPFKCKSRLRTLNDCLKE